MASISSPSNIVRKLLRIQSELDQDVERVTDFDAEAGQDLLWSRIFLTNTISGLKKAAGIKDD